MKKQTPQKGVPQKKVISLKSDCSAQEKANGDAKDKAFAAAKKAAEEAAKEPMKLSSWAASQMGLTLRRSCCFWNQ